MIKELLPGWQVELDRGPNWLFVRLIDQEGPKSASDATSGVASAILNLSEHEFIRRLVLELDCVDELETQLVDELVELQQSINARGGVLRLCGLNDHASQTLQQKSLGQRLPAYRDRREAIMGQPRPEQARCC